jgi:hypothetical protein
MKPRNGNGRPFRARAQSELAFLNAHIFRRQGAKCQGVIAPGLVLGRRSAENCLVPDLGVTCAPPTGEHLMCEPRVLIENPVPHQRVKHAGQCARLPDDIDGGGDRRPALHVDRGGGPVTSAGRRMAAAPEIIAAQGALRLDSIGFAASMRDA